MNRLLSPICLLMALVMVIAAFSVLAIESPQADVHLHQARAAGDEAFKEAFEGRLQQRQQGRWLLVAALFGGAGLMVILAFTSMPTARR